MKKAVAVVLAVVMMLALGATAFAAPVPLSLEQAKKVALDYAKDMEDALKNAKPGI